MGRVPGAGLRSGGSGVARPQDRHPLDCRARLLRRHMVRACSARKATDAMRLLLAGLSHKTAPVDLREKFAISEATLPRALQDLQRLGASEAVVLSTCNRVEFALS